MSSLDAPPPSRTEKVIAAFIASTMGLSVVAFFAIIIGTWQGMSSADYAQGLWPIITWVPNIALPAGFVLIVVLLITSIRRRRSSGDHASS